MPLTSIFTKQTGWQSLNWRMLREWLFDLLVFLYVVSNCWCCSQAFKSSSILKEFYLYVFIQSCKFIVYFEFLRNLLLLKFYPGPVKWAANISEIYIYFYLLVLWRVRTVGLHLIQELTFDGKLRSDEPLLHKWTINITFHYLWNILCKSKFRSNITML
jgi:hypothetical protein